MFETKNLSPQQLSALTSLFLAVPIGIAFLIIENIWIGIIALFLTLIGS
jgi:two-component system phosphate regulon sensor histidine kinase PhoR